MEGAGRMLAMAVGTGDLAHREESLFAPLRTVRRWRCTR